MLIASFLSSRRKTNFQAFRKTCGGSHLDQHRRDHDGLAACIGSREGVITNCVLSFGEKVQKGLTDLRRRPPHTLAMMGGRPLVVWE